MSASPQGRCLFCGQDPVTGSIPGRRMSACCSTYCCRHSVAHVWETCTLLLVVVLTQAESTGAAVGLADGAAVGAGGDAIAHAFQGFLP